MVQRKKVQAVINVNLHVKPGEIFGIIGPNGAGKSTIIKMLMGFIQPSSGTIKINGLSPQNRTVRTQMGYLPENPYYYDHLTVLELMTFSAVTSGMDRKETVTRSQELLAVMGLEAAKDRKLRSYSKGMTQRAGFCFALVHDPDIIILDEPMSGLDPLGRKLIVDLILQLKERGKTILFCSHILNDVERLCDSMAMMHQGRLVKILTKEDIRSKYGDYGLEQAFLENIKGAECKA